MPGRVALPLAAALTILAVVAVRPPRADGRDGKLPRGPAGIAARFPGDVGIENDPDVVLVERFDGTLTEILGRWEDVCGKEHFSLSRDAPKSSASKQSLLMTHIGGGESRNHLYRRLPSGYERVFARFYVKFDPDCHPVHHFGTHVGGNAPPSKWPMMDAGKAPAGDKSFNVAIEPFGRSWVWDYYTYWADMRGSPPAGACWGNSFIRDDKLRVVRGKWVCIELMVRMNDPKDTDGELALWIDGKLVSHLGKGFPKGTWTFDKFTPGKPGGGVTWDHAKDERRAIQGGRPFEGFRWRTDKKLDINYVWTSLYMTKVPKGHVSKVWFDQIVVAKRYIGPIQKPKR